jgi:hypothetical protein
LLKEIAHLSVSISVLASDLSKRELHRPFFPRTRAQIKFDRPVRKIVTAAEKELLETISAIATLVTPILLVLLGGIGWVLKNSIESSKAEQDVKASRIRELEDKLRDDRIETYNNLLEPFFLLFTSEAAFALDPKFKNKDKNQIAIAKMLSVEYRKIGFKLSLVANDAVVRAYNKLMQFFYHEDTDSRTLEEKTCQWIALMGTLLLEIRKSMGNESSGLDRWEMIEWFMPDATAMRRNFTTRPMNETLLTSADH